MRRRFSFIAGALLLLMAVGIYNLPARLLPLLLDDSLIQMSGVSGKALHGSAARVILTTNAGPLHLGHLRWRFEPRSLLRLEPSLYLHSEWGAQRLEVRLMKSGEALRLRDLDASFGAGLVRQFAPVALDGRLSLLFDELAVSPGKLGAAEGRIVWQDAAWLAPRGVQPLGTYAGLVSTQGDGLTGVAVTTLEGPVIAEGSATLSSETYGIDIVVSGRSGPLNADVSQALSLLASPEDNGYRLRLDGDLNTGL